MLRQPAPGMELRELNGFTNADTNSLRISDKAVWATAKRMSVLGLERSE
jgi:hypothetical protein